MRDLLALDVVPAETSAVALAVVGVVAVVMIVPMLALCGSCDEREPDPGHFDRPGPAYHPPNQYPHPPQQQHAPYPPHRQQQHQYPSMQQSQGHPYPQSGSHYSGQQDYQSAHSGYPQSGGYPQSSGSHPHQAQHYHQQQQYVEHQSNQHGYQGQAGHYSAPHPSQPQHAQYPRPGPESRQSASGAPDLQPADVTLEAVEAVLFQVCDGMKGMIKPGKTLVRDTIRTGVSAVIADVTTNYAVDETMMLFPDKNKKSRQMRLYEQLNLKDSMPLVSVDTEIFSHEENGRKVTLPAAIFVNRVKTLADTLKGFKTIEEKQAELFGIWSQLAKVLKMFHQRGWYLRDVTYENVVHVRMGATEGWTLLEFGNASRPKSAISKNTIPPRQCPPELAEEMLMNNEEKVHLSTAGDMWMLGMLVYQVMTGEPYWKKSLKDTEILQIMADPRRPLPHKEKPVLNLVQLILESLMHRDPAKRLTSTDLIKRLEQDMATAGAKTINPGPVVDEQPIVLQGA